MLTGISLNKKLPGSERREEIKLENVRFKRDGSNVEVVLDRKDKEKFLRELSISDKFIQKLKKREKEEIEVYSEFKGSRGYLKLANKLGSQRCLIINLPIQAQNNQPIKDINNYLK